MRDKEAADVKGVVSVYCLFIKEYRFHGEILTAE